MIDLRAMNERVLPMQIHTPLVTSLLQTTASFKILSVCDVGEAFWSIRLADEVTEYFCFLDPRGRAWKFLVAPLGYCNSPAAFNSGLEAILLKAPERYCDDLVCHTDDASSHDTDLRRLFSILRQYRLKLNEKCELFRLKVRFVGHEVSHNVISPILEAETLRNWPLPKTQSGLRSFLGVAAFYKDFVPGLSIIAASLYEITGKNKVFLLEERHVKAFGELKQALLNAVSLRPPSRDPTTRSRLYVDASEVGAGAHLQQLVDGVWYPVAFGTKLWNKRQSLYSAVVREAMAILFGIKWNYRDRCSLFLNTFTKPLDLHMVEDERQRQRFAAACAEQATEIRLNEKSQLVHRRKTLLFLLCTHSKEALYEAPAYILRILLAHRIKAKCGSHVDVDYL